MRIERFIWVDAVVDKLLSKHGVNPTEVEEVFENQPRIRWQESGHRVGEDLYAAYGVTNEGRYVIVFFIVKDGRSALIISAREMESGERRRYERK